MKLWIANCTKQIKEIPYRLPESRRIFELKIMPGEQKALPHDLTKENCDYFINQQKFYGLRDQKTVKNVKEHVGLIYAVVDGDKPNPIDMNRVTEIRERNDEVITEGVEKDMQQTLLAADHTLRSMTGDEGKVNALEIVEQVPKQENRKPNARRMKIAGRNVPESREG